MFKLFMQLILGICVFFRVQKNGVVETLGLQIKSQNVVIIVLYRQPDDSIGGHRSTNAEFTQALGVIKKALAGLPSFT